ncbi:hypothetical protein BQ8482_220006 [Mesorhizobium delmotii]|uniref:Uncharacterized protein n=1 Tax=Mesorhizobium delmotii TaxID=1631247 RepID=A0A2P9AL13_9HYPH|nr:hypothetical protein BQ8482_220006 [Mesorhizobium delmotii]
MAEAIFVTLDRRVPEPAEAACRLAVKIVHGRLLKDNTHTPTFRSRRPKVTLSGAGAQTP